MNIQILKKDLTGNEQLLLELDNKIFSRDYDNPCKNVDELVEMLEDSEIYIAYSDNQPIGYFAFTPKEDHMYLTTFGLIPEFRGKHISKEMMNKFFELVGDNSIKLTVHPVNSPAIVMSLKHGFHIESWKENYHGDGHPRIVLEKKA
jgi:ribosomal protein S18 acetylase RimI-like enzyme